MRTRRRACISREQAEVLGSVKRNADRLEDLLLLKADAFKVHFSTSLFRDSSNPMIIDVDAGTGSIAINPREYERLQLEAGTFGDDYPKLALNHMIGDLFTDLILDDALNVTPGDVFRLLRREGVEYGSMDHMVRSAEQRFMAYACMRIRSIESLYDDSGKGKSWDEFAREHAVTLVKSRLSLVREVEGTAAPSEAIVSEYVAFAKKDWKEHGNFYEFVLRALDTIPRGTEWTGDYEKLFSDVVSAALIDLLSREELEKEIKRFFELQWAKLRLLALGVRSTPRMVPVMPMEIGVLSPKAEKPVPEMPEGAGQAR